MATKAAGRYIEAVGRRKTAVARARITPSAKQSVLVNERELAAYFPTPSLQSLALAPLAKFSPNPFTVTVHVRGGGIAGQAVAVSHAIARAIAGHSTELRGPLKAEGLLKRDPRAKERRKYGLKKARKAPQWSKR